MVPVPAIANARQRTSTRPQARAPTPASPVVVPPPAGRQESAPCSCGGNCPRCNGNSSTAQSANSDSVRFHPSAPEITTPLHARAVTLGQDVYFHPGQYQPGTPAGDQLIEHELAHTLQTRYSSTAPGETDPDAISTSSDSIEENADALASGETQHAETAPAGAMLRSPFDHESSADHTRRTELLQSIQHAEDHLLRLLSTGGLISQAESAYTQGGTPGVWVITQDAFISFPQRDALIRRMIRNLIAMAAQYNRGPISAALPPATPDENNSFSTEIHYPGGSTSYGGSTAPWAQLQAAYELFRRDHGQIGDEFEIDWNYLNPNNVVTPGAARGARRLGRGIGSGAYVVFPDFANDPRNYRLLNGFDPVPRGSPIIELWHDDFGYYYMQGERRIDVESPWSTDHRTDERR